MLSVETVESGATSGREFVDMLSLLDEGQVIHAFAEVSFIQFLSEDGLVEVLELCEGEEWWQKLETYGSCRDVVAQVFFCQEHHLIVVKE